MQSPAFRRLNIHIPSHERGSAFGLLAAIGFPGSAGFIAELHVLVGSFARWGGWIVLVLAGMLIGAAYGLRVVGRLCLKGLPAQDIADMTRTETTAAALLGLTIVGLGVWPAPLLDLVAGSVGRVARLFAN